MRSETTRGGNASFIVIEGIDGSGSTSQGQDLTNHLRNNSGRLAVFTWEPSKGPAGNIIRLALTGRLKGRVENGIRENGKRKRQVTHVGSELDAETMALLFAADRMDHLEAEVRPSLEQGYTVICDRYVMSSLAYQGLYLDLDWLLQINAKAITPDLTIYLDIQAESARQRIQGTRQAEDIYEGITMQSRVREKYDEILSRQIPSLGPVVRVDASRPKVQVFAEMKRIVSSFLDTGTIEQQQQDLDLFVESPGRS